jgi:hypothetical protein
MPPPPGIIWASAIRTWAQQREIAAAMSSHRTGNCGRAAAAVGAGMIGVAGARMCFMPRRF